MTAPAPPAAPTASRTVALADPTATAALAARLAPALAAGTVVWLVGDLGTGKTTLVRGLLRSLGHTGTVKSPTFTLLEPYNLPRFPVYHFDFYRFSSPDEWRDAGFDEYFRGDGACLVEWPELAGPALPGPDLRITLGFDDARRGAGTASGVDASDDDDDDDGDGDGDGEHGCARIARLDAYGDAGLRCLNAAVAAS